MGNPTVNVLLTFDFEEWEGKGIIHQADLDGKTKRVVDVLEDRPATFFLDADTARKYPESVRLLAEKGFELALHSDYHWGVAESHRRDLDWSVQSTETQVARMQNATTMIKQFIPNFEPKGFRAPGLRWNEALYNSLQKLNYLYDSSRLDDTLFTPFFKSGILVFPVNCGEYDSICYKYGSVGAVNIWRDRFGKACQFAAETGSSYFISVAHPAVTGRVKYIGFLKSVLRWMDYIASKTGAHLEFKTGGKAATEYLEETVPMDKRAFILETPILLSSFTKNIGKGRMFTVPEALEEYNQLRLKSDTAMIGEEVEVRSPSQNSLDKVLATNIGTKVSITDVKLLALALDLKDEGTVPIVVADDHRMQVVAQRIGITYQEMREKGILKTVEWVSVCPRCRREYPAEEAREVYRGAVKCEVCGTKLLRAPKKAYGTRW